MPKPDDEKTKSARNFTNAVWFKPAVFVLCTLAIVIIPLVAYRPPTNTLFLDKHQYILEIVTSNKDRQKGLSGRQGLAANEGMLFVEAKSAISCIWMKDMNFDIDIIWVDDKKVIRHLEERVSPKTYPKTFCPEVRTKYVVELPSGTIDKHGLVLGQKLPIN